MGSENLSEKQLNEILLQGTGTVVPPGSGSEVSDDETSNKSSKLITAINNGLAHLDVANRGGNTDKEMTDKTLVKLISDDEESDVETNCESTESSFTASAQHRQANRSKALKDEQAVVRNELLAGCAPGKFAERFPILNEVRTQTMRDCAAAEFVEKVVEISEKLEKINVAMRSECDPYQPGHTDILREITLAAAAAELIHVLKSIPQDAHFSKWRIEVSAVRNLMVPTESPLIMKLKFTHQRFKNSCDFIAQRYMNVNKAEMAQYFSKELEEVVFSLGMKKLALPMVPNGLVSHPEYGDIISKIVSPLKSVKKLVKSAKNQIKEMADRSLDDLIDDFKADSTAGRMKSLAGLPGVKNNIVVIVSGTNKLIPYRLPADTNEPATEMDHLPEHLKGAFITSNKRFFNAKRKGRDNQDTGYKKKRYNE